MRNARSRFFVRTETILEGDPALGVNEPSSEESFTRPCFAIPKRNDPIRSPPSRGRGDRIGLNFGIA